jgi:hypothetical protein
MSDRDEAGVYRILGPPTLWGSMPPALAFRLPAQFHRSRQSRSQFFMSIATLAMLAVMIGFWTRTTPGTHASPPPDFSSELLFIPFLILLFGFVAFYLLHIVNRIVADQYVQLFEGGARISLDEDHIADNRVSRAPSPGATSRLRRSRRQKPGRSSRCD